jgi:ribosomal protein S18 acetylase RimI-like enzyme
MTTIRILDARECDAHTPELSDILIDAIDSGASVSFLGPLSQEGADSFWTCVAEGIANGERVLFAAFDDGTSPATEGSADVLPARRPSPERGRILTPEIVGTAQLVLDTPPNQPHRADIAKVLVHRRARNRGIGRRLMDAVESDARARGKTLLTLDALTGSSAERLYIRCGYVRVGTIPDYAQLPSGGKTAPTTIFYKQLLPTVAGATAASAPTTTETAQGAENEETGLERQA